MALGRIVAEVRRIRPQVVVTFDPFGAYGHPDHVAVSQFATSAAVADPGFANEDGAPHPIFKLYYMAWPPALWEAYEATFKSLPCTVGRWDAPGEPMARLGDHDPSRRHRPLGDGLVTTTASRFGSSRRVAQPSRRDTLLS